MDKKRKFDQISKDIKSIKIQGARNIALAAIKAYSLSPSQSSIKKLISLRPTEPMLKRSLEEIKKSNKEKVLSHFSTAQDKINDNVLKLIKNKDIIFTHCHSTNVSHALIYAKKRGRKFQVYNTETRPLYQGRRTAKELGKSGIKVTMFVDSALAIAIESENRVKKIFIGADALLKEGIINKVGSKTIAELAKLHKIPLYIIADSWKFTRDRVLIEQRNLKEIWANAPKNIRIKNPAFEFVPKKYIKAIVSELGILSYDRFLEKIK